MRPSQRDRDREAKRDKWGWRERERGERICNTCHVKVGGLFEVRTMVSKGKRINKNKAL